MENPHEAEQAVLLERIIKNVVSTKCYRISSRTGMAANSVQDKCNEAVREMNHCIKVC